MDATVEWVKAVCAMIGLAALPASPGSWRGRSSGPRTISPRTLQENLDRDRREAGQELQLLKTWMGEEMQRRFEADRAASSRDLDRCQDGAGPGRAAGQRREAGRGGLRDADDDPRVPRRPPQDGDGVSEARRARPDRPQRVPQRGPTPMGGGLDLRAGPAAGHGAGLRAPARGGRGSHPQGGAAQAADELQGAALAALTGGQPGGAARRQLGHAAGCPLAPPG